MNSTEIESRIIYLLLVVLFNPGEEEVKIEFHKKVSSCISSLKIL